MTDLLSLIKKTVAYKSVIGEKTLGRLSHAYLILSPDGDNLGEILKIFAQLILCKNGDPCDKCRACKLIKEGIYQDVMSFPKNGENVLAEDVKDLIEESFLKPIEGDKKVFLINHGETMNASAQNKILKTLEEPPSGVHILIGATSEFPLLPTVKSRVKKLEIPEFSERDIFNALKDECTDSERLYQAIACGDGTVGKAKSLYGDEKLSLATDSAVDMLINMKSSKDILTYAVKIENGDYDIEEFLSVLELIFRDLALSSLGKEDKVKNPAVYGKLKNAEGWTPGSILYGIEKIEESKKKLKFNGNQNIVLERLLFQILEGKYKWRK